MKTVWSVSISVESEQSLTLDDLWPDPAERPENPTVDDVRRELFGSLDASESRVTRALEDMGMLTFGIESVKVAIFKPIDVCDECKRPLGTNSLGHKLDCRGKAP